jgi:hypothetical protein
MYLIVGGHKLTLDSEDLPRVSEHTWKTAYGSRHIIFERNTNTGTRYHPRTQSLGSFILRTFQEVEFINPLQFKNFSKENLRIVAA